MGTASLVAGIGFMLVGFAVIAQGFLGTYWTVEDMVAWIILNLIIGIPIIIIGGLFLRKYDKDKKKVTTGEELKKEEDEERQEGYDWKTIIIIIMLSILGIGYLTYYSIGT